MADTYKAYEVTSPKIFSLVDRPIQTPGPGQVRIRVEACGVCHSDAGTVEGLIPGIIYPRVPGHEIIGRIDEVGANTRGWETGQRVGVGYFGGQDGTCEPCLRGDFVDCLNPIYPGTTTDGGYAEMVIAEARALSLIPDELDSTDAAPLVCAGITTFNALRNAGLRAGDTVAIQGVGGLGHLGIQFAQKMGFRTVAIGTGSDKKDLALKLGAHIYIDAAVDNAAEALTKLGGAQGILATAPDANAIGGLLMGLAPKGKLLLVAVPSEPVPLNSMALIFGGRMVSGSLTGKAIETQDTLNFSVLSGVRPMVEVMPFTSAPEAYQRMMDGKARFRIVLSMK